MRVAHVVCSDAFAGVERYVSSVAPMLSARGLDVSVIGGEPAAMSAALKDSGVRFIPAASVRDAISALKSLPFTDIVNTHMSDADLAGVMFASPSRRVVSTRHFAARRGRSAVLRAAFSLIHHRIAAQIAISQYVADCIGEKSIVVHSGVPDARQADVESRAPIMLMVQRLEAEKNTDVALRAWAASRGPREGWQLHIAGDGSERPELERLVRELSIGNSVRFLGYRSDITSLLWRASTLIAPTAREGLGISVLEAMAHAVPVIASASGGHLETVGSVPAPWLFPPNDPAAAATLMDKAIAEPVALSTYGALLQRHQRESFSLDAQAKGTIAVYERSLG